MKVAAYQAPYLPFGSMEAVGLIGEQLAVCEAADVEILCCPEAILGGLAHESAGQSPADVALSVEDGELAAVLDPILSTPVTLIVGFTEHDSSGYLFSSAAVITGGDLVAVYRKVYAGYRTVIRSGTELPVFTRGATPFGVMICNDMWYLEPARILAARGAAIIFVPSNSGHLRSPETAEKLRPRSEHLPVARAVENTTTVVVADIAGSQGDRCALGGSRIVDPDGVMLAAASISAHELVVADVEPQRRPFNPRGWVGQLNLEVTKTFTALRPS